jgi:protein O-GlcNAc transferase
VRPEEAACFAEQIVYLPFCYQVNDRRRQIEMGTWTRADCGLPESSFVFCNFNNSQKITPTLFDIWMDFLKQLPDSVLWLLSDNHWAEQNLRSEAECRGIASERLVFAPRVRMEQHLGRHALADLFLDTSPYSAHTTASDALWAGLPLLTFPGRSFASRVAASLLHAMQLPELVARDIGDYSRRAIELANNPGRLGALREVLRERLPTSPLFDIAGTRRDLEAAYREMWEVKLRGAPVRSFRVERSVVDATARSCTPVYG